MVIKLISALNNICIIYNNFNYFKRARYQIISNTGLFHSYTTRKIMYKYYIPPSGLQQSILNERVVLYIEDITKAPGNIYNNIQAQILTSIIIDTIRCTYSATVNSLFKFNSDCKYPHMPQLKILKFIITTHITLGPILDSKALINGNYRVLKTIFLEQLHLNCNKDFKNYLFFIYNNQKTAKYIRAYK